MAFSASENSLMEIRCFAPIMIQTAVKNLAQSADIQYKT